MTICAASGGGEPKSLHLDCWGSVEQVDGFDVTLTAAPQPRPGAERLYFINLGGYEPSKFEEQHKNILVVGPDAKSAVAKALAAVGKWSEPPPG